MRTRARTPAKIVLSQQIAFVDQPGAARSGEDPPDLRLDRKRVLDLRQIVAERRATPGMPKRAMFSAGASNCDQCSRP